MNELPSTEFRKTFARLKESVVVTVNGHPIGTWTPVHPLAAASHAIGSTVAEAGAGLQEALSGKTAQQRRDELLGKVNRSSR